VDNKDKLEELTIIFSKIHNTFTEIADTIVSLANTFRMLIELVQTFKRFMKLLEASRMLVNLVGIYRVYIPLYTRVYMINYGTYIRPDTLSLQNHMHIFHCRNSC